MYSNSKDQKAIEDLYSSIHVISEEADYPEDNLDLAGGEEDMGASFESEGRALSPEGKAALEKLASEYGLVGAGEELSSAQLDAIEKAIKGVKVEESPEAVKDATEAAGEDTGYAQDKTHNPDLTTDSTPTPETTTQESYTSAYLSAAGKKKEVVSESSTANYLKKN